MPKQKIEIEVEVPDGVEVSRQAVDVNHSDQWRSQHIVTLIHTTKKQYRTPTHKDIGKTCEFRNDPSDWEEGSLRGVNYLIDMSKTFVGPRAVTFLEARIEVTDDEETEVFVNIERVRDRLDKADPDDPDYRLDYYEVLDQLKQEALAKQC